MPKTDYEPSFTTNETPQNIETRVLSLKFFLGKLFRSHEMREVSEVEEALSNVKAALVYKGLDFSVIFAEQTDDSKKSTKKQPKRPKGPEAKASRA